MRSIVIDNQQLEGGALVIVKSDKLMPLSTAVARWVRPGMHLHFASSPSRSNASIREIARAFRGSRPEFTLSATGFHSAAHLLGMLRLGKRYVSCFFGDNYPVPRANLLYGALAEGGAELEHWSLWSYVSALRAGALGQAYAVTTSLGGSTLGEELRRAGRFVEIEDPLRRGGTVGLVAALCPDIAFVHASAGDADGNIVASPPYSEGFWGALGANVGAIVTVDQRLDGDAARRRADWLKIPPFHVLAVCEEPFGAHPQPSYVASDADILSYGDDFEAYELYRRMTTDPELFADFSRRVLEASDVSAAYRAFVGAERLAALRMRPSGSPRVSAPAPAAPARVEGAALSPSDRLTLLAARAIAQRVAEREYPMVLAGIGVAFAAARLAKLLLEAEGRSVEIMIETGLSDVSCGPTAHPFLLAAANMAQARRLSSIEDVLGTLTCGARNRCLGVVGAGEIDGEGNLNSTRLASGELLVGSGGANDIASCCSEVLAVIRCRPDRLVPAVHYVTSPGARVLQIATERCVLVRVRAGAPWEINDVYPADTDLEGAVSAIGAKCGFPLDGKGAAFARPPNAAEREALGAIHGTSGEAFAGRWEGGGA